MGRSRRGEHTRDKCTLSAAHRLVNGATHNLQFGAPLRRHSARFNSKWIARWRGAHSHRRRQRQLAAPVASAARNCPPAAAFPPGRQLTGAHAIVRLCCSPALSCGQQGESGKGHNSNHFFHLPSRLLSVPAARVSVCLSVRLACACASLFACLHSARSGPLQAAQSVSTECLRGAVVFPPRPNCAPVEGPPTSVRDEQGVLAKDAP